MLMLVSWAFPIRLVPVQPDQEVRYGPTQRWPSYDLPRVPAAAARPVDGMSYCESVSRLRAGLAGPQASPSCSPATIGHRGVLGNRPPPQQDDARLSDCGTAEPGLGWTAALSGRVESSLRRVAGHRLARVEPSGHGAGQAQQSGRGAGVIAVAAFYLPPEARPWARPGCGGATYGAARCRAGAARGKHAAVSLAGRQRVTNGVAARCGLPTSRGPGACSRQSAGRRAAVAVACTLLEGCPCRCHVPHVRGNSAGGGLRGVQRRARGAEAGPSPAAGLTHYGQGRAG